MIYLSYIFICLAAVFNALMDRIENENFFESVFKKLDQRFWYKRESWKYAYKIFGYKVDAWHLSKTLMVVFACLSIVFYNPFIPIADFIVLGVLWNLTFNLFYNRIFKKST